jgi:hypothetical protein
MLFDYFNIAKSIWSLAYDSITVKIKRNKNNIESKSGFFYFKYKENLYIWKYTMKNLRGYKNQTRTDSKLIFSGQSDLSIIRLISQSSTTYRKNSESKYPIFEAESHEMFPLNETVIPIVKRKIVSMIHQSARVNKLLEDKKIMENGVQ